MLTQLSVRNFALIDSLELDLRPGFTSITGETGAGKSIILGALNLILGRRADLSAIRESDKKCVVEGSFRISGKLKSFFEENDIDFFEETIIRREITPSGKSRSFINDSPVTLEVLDKLARHLIDVHSQHQNLLLSDPAFQLELLDNFAGNAALLNDYRESLKKYRNLQHQKKEMEESASKEAGDSDYLQFLLNELNAANLKKGEQEEVEKELLLAEHSAEISSGIAESLSLLDAESNSVLPSLQQLSSALGAISKYHDNAAGLKERVESARIDLDDIRTELEEMAANSEHEPLKAETLDARLTLLLDLQRKHQAESVEELIAKKESLQQRIDFIEGLEASMQEINAKLEAASSELSHKAAALHKSREAVISGLEDQIEHILHQLNLKSAKFQIALIGEQGFTAYGFDKVDFLFSANPGKPVDKLNKVASGGELSRVMLALKAIMAKTRNLPTIIFDEIDAGVSGEAAGKIGQILKGMGDLMQVIVITHLPQIASMSSHHLKVMKSFKDGQTYSDLTELNANERIDELARLLSGEKITNSALQNARDLLAAKDI